jgi:hypothetical protein
MQSMGVLNKNGGLKAADGIRAAKQARRPPQRTSTFIILRKAKARMMWTPTRKLR